MADRPNSAGLLNYENAGEFVFDPTVSGGEALNRHDLVIIKSADGKLYTPDATAGNNFAGIALQQIALTDTEGRLQNDPKVFPKAVVKTTDAAAINANALRIKGSGGADALVAADLGKDVYAGDSLTLLLLAAAASGNAKVGRIARIDIGAQAAWIELTPFAGAKP